MLTGKRRRATYLNGNSYGLSLRGLRNETNNIVLNDSVVLSRDYLDFKLKVIKNYILLSIICLFKYEKTKNLKFLNTSLKLNDLISSQRKKLIILEDILFYSFIIKKELEVIEILMNKVGVKNE